MWIPARPLKAQTSWRWASSHSVRHFFCRDVNNSSIVIVLKHKLNQRYIRTNEKELTTPIWFWKMERIESECDAIMEYRENSQSRTDCGRDKERDCSWAEKNSSRMLWRVKMGQKSDYCWMMKGKRVKHSTGKVCIREMNYEHMEEREESQMRAISTHKTFRWHN